MTKSLLRYSLLTCLTERNCLRKKIWLNIFSGFITLQNKFLQHLCIFCMLPLKTVRLYKSEIAFILIFVEEIFAEVVNLLKNLFNIVEEGYLFCKKLDDLQEKITIIDTNCIRTCSLQKASF